MAKMPRRKSDAQAGLAAEGRIVLGAITGAHGVRGLVKVKSFTEVPEDILSYGPLGLGDSGREVVLTGKGSVKGLLLAALDGITDRNAADALRGTELSVPRDRLPVPEADEDGEDFYITDLVGLTAADPNGASLGNIVAVHDFGAGDMLEVAPQGVARGGKETWYVPFTRDAVPEVDLANGSVTIADLEELVASGRESGEGDDV